MARHNNTSRSLIIMSKLQGWDPCTIEGKEFANNEYPEDRATKGDTAYLHGPLPGGPQDAIPDPGAPGPDNRSPGPGGKSHGKHDPFAGGSIAGG